MVERLPADQLPALLEERLLDWALVDGGRLEKRWRFADFAAALAFLNRAAAECERLDHHADFELGWGRVQARIWSHDAGGLTEADFALAEAIDRL